MKLESIEQVYRMWKGSFIGSSRAISKIGRILDTKEATNVCMLDINGNKLGEVERVLIEYK